MAELEVRIDVRGLERFMQQAKPSLRKVVKVAAFNVERRAKELVHVDTGATRASIYPAIAGEPSGYSQAALAVRVLNPNGGVAGSHGPPAGDDGLSATVGPATAYAKDLEFGTHNQPAYPFMRPALEHERHAFEAAIIEALKEAGANG